MDAEKYEKKIAEHRKLFLTDKRVGQKDKNLTKEIPIDKIDSVSHSKSIRLKLMILGLIIVIWTIIPLPMIIQLLPFAASSQSSSIMALILIQLAPGMALVLIGYFFKKNELVIKSNTLSLYEKGRGAEEFVKRLRETLYK